LPKWISEFSEAWSICLTLDELIKIRTKGEFTMADNDGDLGSFLAGFLIGGLIGAATALLMAPQSGEETRALIRDKSIELRDQAVETAEEARQRAEAAAAEAKERAEYYTQQAKQMASKMKSDAKSTAKPASDEAPAA
jgi:gas vesicle protein